jgi:hypothetical protein
MSARLLPADVAFREVSSSARPDDRTGKRPKTAVNSACYARTPKARSSRRCGVENHLPRMRSSPGSGRQMVGKPARSAPHHPPPRQEGHRRQEGEDRLFYRPLLSRADYLQEESKGFLDRLFKGEVAPLVAHLAEHRALTAKDLRKLKKLIAEMEGEAMADAGQQLLSRSSRCPQHTSPPSLLREGGVYRMGFSAAARDSALRF